MNPRWMWLLAGAALLAAWLRFGWQGALVVFSGAVFLMLLQFTRALRALQAAGRAPVGHVGSAVMLNSKLRAGMRLPDILRLTGSLGVPLERPEQAAGAPVVEAFRWSDEGGVAVEIELVDGRCSQWQMQRPEPAAIDPASPADAGGSGPADEQRPIA